MKLIHHILPEDIYELKVIFAHLTELGWVIPEWIVLLEGPYECVDAVSLKPSLHETVVQRTGIDLNNPDDLDWLSDQSR